ncbi:MAG TPA: TonB-dependent siderophore receptor [Prosthecobacter sp.]
MSKNRARRPGTDLLTVTTVLCATGTLMAQTAPSKPATKAEDEKPANLDEVLVEADAAIYNVQRLESPKYTEPLRDIPQTITVIPKAVIQERAAFTLTDVLRNTPGISLQAGEGVSGAGTGDNLTIRGFNSRSDFFIDNMRDLGGYSRDPFNVEQVEIAKGPASTTTGRGTTGGSINLATKMAGLGSFNLSQFTYGSDNLYRGTVDVNEQIGEHAAFRLNGMYHHNDTPGRDNVTNERYGIAASLGLGLGTDTRFFLNYQRFEENNTPDFGIPWIPTGSSFVAPNASFNGQGNTIPQVPYSNFYGRRNYDFQKNQVDIFTAIFEHDFSKSLRIRNTTRYERVHADGRVTAPRFRDSNGGIPGNQFTTILVAEEQRRRATNEYFANQTLLMADFETGAVEHSLVAGLEFYWERQLTAQRAGNTRTTDLYDPSATGPLTGTPNVNRDTTVFGIAPTDLPGPGESHLDTISLFLFDTLKFGRMFELVGGVRYDHMSADQRGSYYTGVNDIYGESQQVFYNRDDLFSFKGAFVFKPVEHGSIYFGYGMSYNPTIDSGIPGGLGLTPQGNPSVQGLDPEKSNSYEIGTKWDLFKERLSIMASVFRTEKTNARTTTAGLTSLSGNQLVEGVELGIAGQITRNWNVFAGYAHLASEVRYSAVNAEIGQSLANVPEHTFNLWTTYAVIPSKLQVGFGAQYMGKVIGNPANPGRVVPDWWTMDAMVSYQFTPNFGLRLNINNIADWRYIQTSSGTGHVIPGPGRSIALTATVKF